MRRRFTKVNRKAMDIREKIAALRQHGVKFFIIKIYPHIRELIGSFCLHVYKIFPLNIENLKAEQTTRLEYANTAFNKILDFIVDIWKKQ